MVVLQTGIQLVIFLFPGICAIWLILWVKHVKMPAVFQSHIPTWLFLIITVASKITGITITIKIRGEKCLGSVWGFGRFFFFFFLILHQTAFMHLYMVNASAVYKQFLPTKYINRVLLSSRSTPQMRLCGRWLKSRSGIGSRTEPWVHPFLFAAVLLFHFHPLFFGRNYWTWKGGFTFP